jgi:hypothetical protein
MGPSSHHGGRWKELHANQDAEAYRSGELATFSISLQPWQVLTAVTLLQVRGLEFNAFSPNLLASGAADGELCIWDVANPAQPSLYPALKVGLDWKQQHNKQVAKPSAMSDLLLVARWQLVWTLPLNQTDLDLGPWWMFAVC